jgi:predicted RNA binding protein YcfA (HicA-like mRNA interferase family)
MKFSELVRLLEENGFKLIKEKVSIRYYGKSGWNNLIGLIIMAQKKFPEERVMQY